MQNIADEGIQIFGGMGFSAETPMEGAWRDLGLVEFTKEQMKLTEC